MLRRLPVSAITLGALLLSACDGSASTASPAPATSAPAAATVASTTPPPAASGSLTWSVAAGSQATVRVREQLARLNAPNDAVLVAPASGTFTLLADGSFAPSSSVSVKLDDLKSDSNQRDGFIKNTVLETGKFPTATFVPLKAVGLTMPLAASGDLAFKVVGTMTIHGVSKEVTFDVAGKRDGTTLAATATASPTWKFGDFGMSPPRAPVLLSVVDEVRVEFALSATQAR